MLVDTGDIRSFFKIGGQPFQGIDQPQIVEDSRPQADSQAADILDVLIDQIPHRPGPSGGGRIGILQAAGHPGRIHAQRRQHLAQFIVQFPGNGRSLRLMRRHDPGRQSAQLVPRLFFGGDVRRDAADPADPARLAIARVIVQWKLHRQINMHAVRVRKPFFHLQGPAAFADLPVIVAKLPGDIGRQKIGIRAAPHPGHIHPQDLFIARIDQDVPPFQVFNIHHIRRIL